MQFNLDTTLRHLSDSKPVHPSKVVLFLPLAFSEKKYQEEKYGKKWWLKLKNRLSHDFVKGMWYYDNWEIYRKQVVLPILQITNNLAKISDSVINLQTNYNTFRNSLYGNQFDIIFLATHHIQNEKNDGIEFSDGGVRMNQFKKLLLEFQAVSEKSLINAICDSESIELSCYNQSQKICSLATANWKVPVVESIDFLAKWIAALDGNHTLSEGYNIAIKNSFKEE